MLEKLSSLLDKPVFNSLYNRVFTKSILDDLDYPMDSVYLDVDVNALEDAKTRCLMMNTNMTVDYFTVTLNGDVIVNLNILIKYAKYKGLDELIIPEGITFLYFESGYLNYYGKIVFPSTLKVLSPLLLNNMDNMSFDYGSITMNYSNQCDFGVLDFSKCLSINTILSDAFNDLSIKEIILPESIETIKCSFDKDYIKKVYINSPCLLLDGISSNMVFKDNRVKYFDGNWHSIDIPNSLKEDIIVVNGGLLKGKLTNLNKIYYSLDYNLLLEDRDTILENYIGDFDRLNQELREILVCLIHSINLSNIHHSRLLPLFFKFKITNNPIALLIMYMLLCNTDEINISSESDNVNTTFFNIVFGNEDLGRVKSFYIYNNNLDIDEYPVRNRDYFLSYNDGKFLLYVEKSMTNMYSE